MTSNRAVSTAHPRGFWRWALLGLVLLAVAGQAEAVGKRKKARLLEQTQIAYATAVRWGEFESAWEFVEPETRAERPLTDLDLERFRQVEISGYRDVSSAVEPDGGIVRNIELRVVNRHTMAERVERYRERWQWDDEAERWWLTVGLPDLWDGQ
ncbi:hypothetical protein CSC70_01305 [Pseudoxanthomonas kalamensis DSM 18571]|uniref:hypothetical protein n=1 Tax=Pseudoxanthomonas kalamensis TaxID=289483 RepID=UPI001391C4E9|nr:hypothetical protein [Pseudoxanthomonas kalamensis]KAF1712661.1 hypothetical protein CSC70_01305 [Pseudoxanthomonas kalamensis DSM 18571]